MMETYGNSYKKQKLSNASQNWVSVFSRDRLAIGRNPVEKSDNFCVTFSPLAIISISLFMWTVPLACFEWFVLATKLLPGQPGHDYSV